MKLIVRKGPGEGVAFALPAEGTAIVGRGAESSILLAHASVSSRHAAIHASDGAFLLEDLGSTNGTLLNGKRIERAVLRPGDSIRIGAFALECVEEAAPAPSAADGTERGSAPRREAAPPPDEARWRDAIARLGAARQRILREMRKRIVGQDEVIDDLLIALFARGHALLVGVPGLAKTLMVRTLASLLALEFKRIQFTPDLMPSDITGTEILEEDPATRARGFKFVRGPIFANIVLADEINRTPPKTQAALLEAMQEYRVTAAGKAYDLAPPFFVLATQNPIEQEGTYPLPEAQLDRFMFEIRVAYPSRDEEVEILRATTIDEAADLEPVLDGPEVIRLQALVRAIPVSDYILYYAADLARASRPSDPAAPEFVRRYVTWGAGPRAAQCLVLGAKARALLRGTPNVSCEDVRAVAKIVMRHRIFLNFRADSDGLSPDGLVEKLLAAVPEPGEEILRRAGTA